MRKEIFDPEDITKDEMNYIADILETYIETLESLMIIPEELKDEYGEKIDSAIVIVKKLISKLRKGKKSVFLDDFEFNIDQGRFKL